MGVQRFGVQGLGVQGSGFRVQGFRVWGFRVQGFRVQWLKKKGATALEERKQIRIQNRGDRKGKDKYGEWWNVGRMEGGEKDDISHRDPRFLSTAALCDRVNP